MALILLNDIPGAIRDILEKIKEGVLAGRGEVIVALPKTIDVEMEVVLAVNSIGKTQLTETLADVTSEATPDQVTTDAVGTRQDVQAETGGSLEAGTEYGGSIEASTETGGESGGESGGEGGGETTNDSSVQLVAQVSNTLGVTDQYSAFNYYT